MSEDIRANILRAGNMVVADVSVQLDKQGAPEQGGYQGGEPRFMYDAFTMDLPTSDPFLVLQGDLLIDQENIDPKTTKPRQFRISTDPERFPLDGHWEWACDLYRGT